MTHGRNLYQQKHFVQPIRQLPFRALKIKKPVPDQVREQASGLNTYRTLNSGDLRVRLPTALLPFAFQRLQRIFHIRAIGRRFFADITLTAAKHLQRSVHLRMSVTEFVFLGEWRHGVDMDFTRIGNPYNVVVQRVFACRKQTSQFINSRLLVDIHVMLLRS
ncbi:hypothetical protein ALP59_04701 [Pseudomonas savastanoi]|uniref:Uncharacterized protein n=1 Tax=Pseudomonas savastanoi TaxID=29438 RepID=A0A3M5GCX2_PSESS|nr:hypothetical protein ALP59_04701 [Pseudomonas savastanoi]